MKIEFDFDVGEEAVVPLEGVAALYCFAEDEEPLVIYGAYSTPDALKAVGLYTVALDDAKEMLSSGAEYTGE